MPSFCPLFRVTSFIPLPFHVSLFLMLSVSVYFLLFIDLFAFLFLIGCHIPSICHDLVVCSSISKKEIVLPEIFADLNDFGDALVGKEICFPRFRVDNTELQEKDGRR
jgi:hypothetical protein